MKSSTTLLFVILIISVSNINAQNITAKLGGSSTSDTYTITDNSAGELFKVNGAGDAYLTRNLKLSNASVMYLGSNKVFSCPDKNTILGRYAGSSNTANYNTFIGYMSGNSNTTGSSNTFVGRSAGSDNTAGKYNTFIGQQSGSKNTGGQSNTFIGRNAGYNNTYANHNTFIGESAGYENVGKNNNTLVGYSAGKNNSDGYSNVFIGSECAESVTQGNKNVIIGAGSCKNSATANHNVIIGMYAGFNSDGSSNVFLGNGTGYSNNGNHNVFIGTSAGSNETGSSKLYIESSNSSSPLIWGDFDTDEVKINGDLTVTGTFSNPSDIRYKKNLSELDNTLQNIQKLRGVYFYWNKEKYPELIVGEEKQIGVIAQEVEKVYPELVKTDAEGFKSVDYSKLSAVLIEAVKEQQTQIDDLKSELIELKNRFNSFAENNKATDKEVKVSLSK
jgi:hypothetical protein